MRADATLRCEKPIQTASDFVEERFGLDLARYPTPVRERIAEAIPPGTTELAGDLLGSVIALCSIGETTFLRDRAQFTVLAAVAAERARRGRIVRAWSAGCATGEEAYGIAAVLALAGVESEVLGTDLNAFSLARARSAKYRPWSLRGVEPADVAGWLVERGDDFVVTPGIACRATFETHNLAAEEPPGAFDVVFCRNVLLYFSQRAARIAYERIAAASLPDTVLFIGPFDPTPPSSLWREQWVGSTRFYRRAPEIVPQPEPAPPTRPSIIPPSPDSERSRLRASLSVARALAAAGERAAALAILDEISATEPLEPSTYVLAAMVADEAGLHERALDAARRCGFLAPEEPIAQYLLAVCFERVGEHARSAVHASACRATLERIRDGAAPLPLGEGFTANQLRRMLDARSR